jgi:hypothetical protein
MNEVIQAFYMTIELWVFVAILGLALVVDEIRTKLYN